MAKKGEYKIPFDAHGNLMQYPDTMTGGYMDTETGEAFLNGIHYNLGEWPNSQAYLNDEVRDKMRKPTCKWHPVVWRDNYTFEDTIQYDSYSRGRSAADIWFKSTTTGHAYGMFMTDFNTVMCRGGLQGDKVTGRWTFIKRGANYGLRMADEEG